MKKTSLTLLATLMLFLVIGPILSASANPTAVSTTSASTFNPSFFFENELLELPFEPHLDKGVTHFPARFLLGKYELTTHWVSATRTVSAKNDNFSLKLTIDSKKVIINDEEIEIAAAPKLVNNGTVLPLRAIASIFEHAVVWDREFNLVSIASESDQSIFAVLLNLEQHVSGKAENVIRTLDSNAWEYKTLSDNVETELAEKYAYEIDDIGVLELVNGQAQVGVTLIRTKPDDATFTATTTSYTYLVKKQKNGVWRIYNILPGTEPDPETPPAT